MGAMKRKIGFMTALPPSRAANQSRCEHRQAADTRSAGSTGDRMTQSSRLSALYGVIDYFYQRLVLPSISGSQEKKSSFKVVDIDWIRYFILATKRARATDSLQTMENPALSASRLNDESVNT